MTSDQKIKEQVRDRYAASARQVKESAGSGCCGSESESTETVSSKLYETDELQGLPQEAVVASLGCGNPVALAEMKQGETVLDLGSGGGIDVLLSARRVGPTGKAYGLDMTDEMLELARENQRKAGVTNVEFLKGEMEEMPLPDGEVDVIISNCVVNLSPDKDAVLGEAFRVLTPGGRVAIADIVVRGELPEEYREDAELWPACLAGALQEQEYRAKLEGAGFEGIEMEVLQVYTESDAVSAGLGEMLKRLGKSNADVQFVSMIVRATKPGGAAEKAFDEPLAVVASEGGSPESGRCC
jgi:SAM-dependent methyltransferase